MTRAELQAFFPTGLYMGATNYAVPTLTWLQGPCYEAFKKRYWDDNLTVWTVRWECRDFARAFACFATECWALTAGNDPSDALSVGEIWFLRTPGDPSSGHAVCPIITDNGLQFLEPQTGLICDMSPEQLSSRFFVRF